MSQTPGPSLGGHGGWGTSGHLTGRQGAGLYQWGFLVGAGAISLHVAGRIARPVLVLAKPVATRLFVAATSPINWALYNAYREAGDFAHWARGGEMELGVSVTGRPWTTPGGTLLVPFPWLDIQPSQSSGGGGPGGLPNLHQPPPSIEETGEILSNPPMVGGKTGSPKARKKKCPPGFVPVWSHRKQKYVCMAKPGTTYRTKVRYSKKG